MGSISYNGTMTTCMKKRSYPDQEREGCGCHGSAQFNVRGERDVQRGDHQVTSVRARQ
jgi:hypothetical protein